MAPCTTPCPICTRYCVPIRTAKSTVGELERRSDRSTRRRRREAGAASPSAEQQRSSESRTATATTTQPFAVLSDPRHTASTAIPEEQHHHHRHARDQRDPIGRGSDPEPRTPRATRARRARRRAARSPRGSGTRLSSGPGGFSNLSRTSSAAACARVTTSSGGVHSPSPLYHHDIRPDLDAPCQARPRAPAAGPAPCNPVHRCRARRSTGPIRNTRGSPGYSSKRGWKSSGFFPSGSQRSSGPPEGLAPMGNRCVARSLRFRTWRWWAPPPGSSRGFRVRHRALRAASPGKPGTEHVRVGLRPSVARCWSRSPRDRRCRRSSRRERSRGRSPAASTTSCTAASEVRTSWLAHWFRLAHPPVLGGRPHRTKPSDTDDGDDHDSPHQL